MQPAPPFSRLFIDFNSFFASVEQQENPRLSGRPVVVAPTNSDYTSAIAASYEAKAFGIRTGTRISEARRLCPEVAVVVQRSEVYIAYHHRLMAEIARHAPILKVHSIDECCCGLIGDECSEPRVIATARAIKAGLARCAGPAIRCSIGVAATTLLAKLAADMQKPDGLVLLHPQHLPGAILHLQPKDLCGIGRRMGERLEKAGITTMAQLWAVPARQMRALWGSVVGERFWHALHGHEIPALPTQTSTIGHSRVLAPEMRAPGAARLAGRALVIKAAERLRRQRMTAAALSLVVGLPAGRRDADMRLPATQDSFQLLDGFDRLWRGLSLPRSTRLKTVAVRLHALAPVAQRQGDLFGSPSGTTGRSKREQLWTLLDALDIRHGRRLVTLASQRDLGLDYLGAKIAFTHIPDAEDLLLLE